MNDDELRRDYQRSISDTPPGKHPEPEQIAEMVTGDMREDERFALLEHVLRCTVCKRELDLLRAANAGASAAERRTLPSRWMALAAAALILVGLGALALRGNRVAVPVDAMRGGHAAVSVIEPPPGAALSAPVQFTWHAMDGAQRYHVELLSLQGEVIASWTTPDTALAMSDSARVIPPGSYDMWVRALLVDRTEVSSSMVRFSVK